MAEYDRLMAELDTILAKAQPIGDEDDARIAEAAGDEPTDTLEDPDADPAMDEEGEGEDFMKSFAVTLENGEQVEAYDATAMLKSMHGVARRQAETLSELRGRLAGADKVMAKQAELLKALTGRVNEQAGLIKALREQPGGRRTVTSAPPSAAAKPAARGEILAKALDAQRAGRIGSMDVAAIEARLNNGLPIPDHLTRAITAA